MGASSSLPAANLTHTPLGFTLQVVERIQDDAAIVCKEKGMRSFSSSLRAELFNINEVLNELDESTYNNHMEGRISVVLRNLERLCQWPRTFEHEVHNQRTFAPTHYPSLHDLLLADSSVQDCIRKVAKEPSARTFRKHLLKALSDFATMEQDLSAPGIADMMGHTAAKHDTHDNHVYLQSLYAAITDFCGCECTNVGGRTVANLRLNWFSNEEHCNESYMTPAYLYLPSAKGKSFTLLRYQAKLDGSKVRFVEDHQSAMPQSLTRKSRPADKFCTLISRGTHAQLHFIASDNGLEYQKAAQASKSFLTNSESVPLRSLIRSRQLTAKSRALLSFFIARSVWQFYNSGWMKSWWSKECVHFMSEHQRPSSEVVSINEPFLQIELEDKTVPGEDHETSYTFTTHLYPKILGLGVMLLEIELGKSIQELSRPDVGDLSEINTLHMAACDIIRDDTVWPPEDIFTDIREVIKICIEPDLQKLGLTPSPGLLNDTMQVRDRLYESVVVVLEDFVRKAWDHPDKVKINPIEPRMQPKADKSKTESAIRDSKAFTFDNKEQIMSQVGQQNVTGDIHYHFACTKE